MPKLLSRRNNRKPHELNSDKVALVIYLRYGALTPDDKTKIWHSYLSISKMLPLTVSQVKQALMEDEAHVRKV